MKRGWGSINLDILLVSITKKRFKEARVDALKLSPRTKTQHSLQNKLLIKRYSNVQERLKGFNKMFFETLNKLLTRSMYVSLIESPIHRIFDFIG